MWSTSLLGPRTHFMKLTFFADRHGGADCSIAPTSDACRRAASDAAVYHGVAGAVAHSVAWVFALLLASYSDRAGRRPLLIAASVISLSSRLALAAHVFSGVTLWVFLIVEPTLTIFDTHGVFLAVMSDVIKDSTHRVVASTVLLGVAFASGGGAGIIGSAMTARVAVASSLCLGILQVAFIVTSFPETAPRALRVDLGEVRSPLAMIHDAVQVVVTNAFIFRMTLVVIFSGLASTGFYNVWTPYLTAYIGFNQASIGQLLATGGITITISFVFVMKPLLRMFGEFRSLRICLAVKCLFFFWCAASWKREQVFVVHAVLLGPAVLLVPIIISINSNLVGEEGQGQMQGVLAACKAIATAVGEVFFGWFYRYATDSGRNPNRTAVLPPLMIVIGLCFVAWALAASLDPDSMREDNARKKPTTALGTHAAESSSEIDRRRTSM